MLQCVVYVAVCCSVLINSQHFRGQRCTRCVAVYCGVLQCVAICCGCGVLQDVAACCSVLINGQLLGRENCIAVWCSALQCVAVCCNMLRLWCVAGCCCVS